MNESPNPLIPSGWEAGVAIIGIIFVVLAILAWVLLLVRKPVTPAYRLLLALAVLAFPVLGPVAAILISWRAPHPPPARDGDPEQG
ncbi:hypothetical protein [Arthrobacter sp. NPDC090010]|uniref:hypothetical protein n=1 Tax=Arthrobacter sp. NPDC090010 TaxID=3363942 RepID=UPI00380B050D